MNHGKKLSQGHCDSVRSLRLSAMLVCMAVKTLGRMTPQVSLALWRRHHGDSRPVCAYMLTAAPSGWFPKAAVGSVGLLCSPGKLLGSFCLKSQEGRFEIYYCIDLRPPAPSPGPEMAWYQPFKREYAIWV